MRAGYRISCGNERCYWCQSPDILQLGWHAAGVTAATNLEPWLRETCSRYEFDVRGILQWRRSRLTWPLVAADEHDLLRQLEAARALLPLPKEPAALANVLEVSIADFLTHEAKALGAAVVTRGTERGYPDLEFSGEAFGGGHHAVDIKVARWGVTQKGNWSSNTQSRITLYTGNTYFKHPTLHWPGALRPFAEYSSHLDVLGIYKFDPDSPSRLSHLELVVYEPWRIASHQRSSTTREYIGAVMNLNNLREGRGEFETSEAFYKFWRAYRFKTPDALNQQLAKLIREQAS